MFVVESRDPPFNDPLCPAPSPATWIWHYPILSRLFGLIFIRLLDCLVDELRGTPRKPELVYNVIAM